MQDENYFGSEKISKILIKIAPPVMLAQLIQALYNIVDSFFVGRFSESGLTALSIIYPVQLLMIAFAVGTGVGFNTSISFNLGLKNDEKAKEIAGIATPVAAALWCVFSIVCYFGLPFYADWQTDSPEVIRDVVLYGRIVCVASFGLFLESVWTKVLQARGDMKTPMVAQIAGAFINIVLDPILIFGMWGMPKMGIAGAAVATIAGQIAAALIVMPRGFEKSPKLSVYKADIINVYKLGIPNIIMQSAYTFYILGLNLILAKFSDQAVTALGLYYKWQSFFFIPLGAMQTCIVPVISYNYAMRAHKRCQKALWESVIAGMSFMFVGMLCFEFIPGPMLSVFTKDPKVLAIGTVGFRIIGISFLPLVTSLSFPVFFQAIGSAFKSSMLTIVRTVFLFVPLGFLFSLLGLDYFWITFPVTELITTAAGFLFYKNFLKNDSEAYAIHKAVDK